MNNFTGIFKFCCTRSYRLRLPDHLVVPVPPVILKYIKTDIESSPDDRVNVYALSGLVIQPYTLFRRNRE